MLEPSLGTPSITGSSCRAKRTVPHLLLSSLLANVYNVVRFPIFSVSFAADNEVVLLICHQGCSQMYHFRQEGCTRIFSTIRMCHFGSCPVNGASAPSPKSGKNCGPCHFGLSTKYATLCTRTEGAFRHVRALSSGIPLTRNLVEPRIQFLGPPVATIAQYGRRSGEINGYMPSQICLKGRVALNGNDKGEHFCQQV